MESDVPAATLRGEAALMTALTPARVSQDREGSSGIDRCSLAVCAKADQVQEAVPEIAGNPSSGDPQH